MRRATCAALFVPLLVWAGPLAAQMDHSQHGGMAMPMPSKAPAAKTKPTPAAKAPPGKRPLPRQVGKASRAKVAKPTAGAVAAPCAPEHAAMGHCTLAAPPVQQPAPIAMSMPQIPDPACSAEHAAMGHCAAAPSVRASVEPAGTALPAGDAPPPTPPAPIYADRIWGRDAMASPRDAMRREHGGGTFSQVVLNIAEVQVRDGRDGYRWDGEGWFGGDVNRVAVKSEGSGTFGRSLDDAEAQLLYSRAIDPYFNLQVGVRQDIGRGPSPTYAVVGVEGLAPYWFDVEATLFLSDRGDLLGRIEGYYDQRITQRLILQPRVELNLAAQDVARTRTGAGLSDAEIGLRLRYEMERELAPYVGVSWERKFGASARFARDADDDTGGVSLALGLRAWF